jgi:hypothetical protein
VAGNRFFFKRSEIKGRTQVPKHEGGMDGWQHQPSVAFAGGYGEFLDMWDEVVRRLLELVLECLKTEHCEPMELAQAFFDAWTAPAEEQWLRVCKGGSQMWAWFMTERCVSVMRTTYRAVRRVNAQRDLAFPNEHRGFVANLLVEAVKRLVGKKGPPSALAGFEDHNFKKVKADETNAVYVLRPVFTSTCVRKQKEEELTACLMLFGHETSQAMYVETLRARFLEVMRASLYKEHSAGCQRFGGLAYGVKEYMRKEATKKRECAWECMLMELLVDIVDTACDAYVWMNHQHPPGMQQVMVATHDGPAKDALGQFLSEEVEHFFELNAEDAEPVPCYVMHMLRVVNMPRICRGGTGHGAPRYLFLKMQCDIRMLLRGVRRKTTKGLSMLGTDLVTRIIDVYVQLCLREQQVEFCEEAYVEACIA